MKKLFFLIGMFLSVLNILHAGDGAAAVEEARRHIGEPYLWGGGHGNYVFGKGIDCSGLIIQAYKPQGINVDGTTKTMARMDNCPTVSDWHQVEPGDAIIYDRGHIHHVTMVAMNPGNDGHDIQIVEAPHTGAYIYEHRMYRSPSKIAIIKRFSECDGQPNASGNGKTGGKDYLDEAYHLVTGMSKEELEKDRENDYKYIFVDSLCECNDDIMTLFAMDTKEMLEKHLNPAIDRIIWSVRFLLEMVDIEKKKIEEGKIINALYSYSDKGEMRIPKPPGTKGKCGDGCNPIDLNSKEGMEEFLKVIDCMENSSTGSYDAHNDGSGAHGRYQFIPSTAAEYCKKVGNGCCANWKNSPACQDAMFAEFTKDNAKGLTAHGVGINTCSLYIAHQQGVAGYLWITGRSTNPPAGVESNMRGNGATGGSLEDVRKNYINFWNNKFNGDITSGAGGGFNGGGNGFKDFVNKFLNLISSKRKFNREGVLLEIKESNRYFKKAALGIWLRGLEDGVSSNISTKGVENEQIH